MVAAFAGSLMLGSGAGAYAHTTVRSQGTEGTTEDNALRIGHGCSEFGGVALPVIAQSVVFPSAAPVVTSSDGAPVAGLSAVITQGSIAGLVKPLQDASVFMSRELKYDALGNVIGFSATDGSLATDMLGRVPFQFTSPGFVPSSCAKRLLVKVAIADVCSTASGDAVRTGKVNLWIPDNGSQYATMGGSAGVDGVGSPATVIVNRNITSNPLPPACGAGVDITVTPSAADVDANLAIPGVWGLGSAATASVAVVEYYNAGLDHYFITWVPGEIAKLDDGTAIKGWARTGRTMRTYKAAQAGTSPVCRYYIPPGLGDSHFFGRGTAECASTGQKNPSFVLEDSQFMYMTLPAAGVCPTTTVPIYRTFSNRSDANHRYMTDKLTRGQMQTFGWLAEGDGPDLVVMCAPL